MAAPADGDVRLVPLLNATSESAPCEAVHQGVVQILLDGVWGLLCATMFGRRGKTGFTVDAKVICRQLGFPFGSVFDSSASGGGRDPDDQYDYADYSSYGSPSSAPLDDVPVFATRGSCTGTEERLDECFFPERDPLSNSFATSPARGASSTCDRFQATRLAVACRQLEIEGPFHLLLTQSRYVVMVCFLLCMGLYGQSTYACTRHDVSRPEPGSPHWWHQTKCVVLAFGAMPGRGCFLRVLRNTKPNILTFACT